MHRTNGGTSALSPWSITDSCTDRGFVTDFLWLLSVGIITWLLHRTIRRTISITYIYILKPKPLHRTLFTFFHCIINVLSLFEVDLLHSLFSLLFQTVIYNKQGFTEFIHTLSWRKMSQLEGYKFREVQFTFWHWVVGARLLWEKLHWYVVTLSIFLLVYRIFCIFCYCSKIFFSLQQTDQGYSFFSTT